MTRVKLLTDKGDINLELFPKEAPGTVANFVKLIEAGFYDGLAFHRVIPGFVIQGGCPNTRPGATGMPGTGGPGWKIKCETAGNPHQHQLGALSMAHAGKDTGGSQFFITTNAAPHLTGRYTRVGQVEDVDRALPLLDDLELGARIERIEVLKD